MLFPHFDKECFASRRLARSLEHRFRRTGLDVDRQAWLRQLGDKRKLFQSKESSYWTAKINNDANNSHSLWNCINNLLHRSAPSPSLQSDLTAKNLSDFFCHKISAVRASTAGAEPPVFVI